MAEAKPDGKTRGNAKPKLKEPTMDTTDEKEKADETKPDEEKTDTDQKKATDDKQVAAKNDTKVKSKKAKAAKADKKKKQKKMRSQRHVLPKQRQRRIQRPKGSPSRPPQRAKI